MDRKILTFGGYFEEFITSVDEKIQRKIDYALDLLRMRHKVSKKFVKYLRDELYELRIELDSNIYRVFLFSTMVI